MNHTTLMQKFTDDPRMGLNRVPYYPELKTLTDDDPSSIAHLVLSIMLYWHALDSHHRFNARQHLYQIARILRDDPPRILKALDYLADRDLLTKEEVSFKTQSSDPLKAVKTDTFYAVDFQALSVALKKKGLLVPIKVLRRAADDTFDFMCYISPRALPLTQGLIGTIAGEDYNQCCLMISKIITGICANEAYERFSYLALAPGWRMLVQPPCTAEDIATRWLRDGERSVDIDLTDGSFFLPDGDFFGTKTHQIWHCGRASEPRTLAAALFMCAATITDEIHFISDLRLKSLFDAMILLKQFTGFQPRLDLHYFEGLDLTKDQMVKEQELYQEMLNSLTKIPML